MHRLLPAAAPGRRVLGQVVLQDRPAAGVPQRDVAAADETQRAVVEIVAVEVVHALAQRAGAHERVEDLLLEHVHRRGDLVGVIATDHAAPRRGVIRRADLRQQQQVHVVLGERAQHHHAGGLFDLVAIHIHIGDAGGALAGVVGVDPGDVAARAVAEIGLLQQHRQDRGLRAGLGIVAAAEPLAVTAIRALAHLHAQRVAIRFRGIGRGAGERIEAGLARRLVEQHGRGAAFQWRQRIATLACTFERVAAGLLHAADIAGGAGNAAQVFEAVVVRLQFVVCNAPVLQVHGFGDELPAVALLGMRADLEVLRQEAPALTVPVHARATDAGGGEERAQVAHRQRGLVGAVAEGERLALGRFENLLAHGVAQFILDGVGGEVRHGVAKFPAFQCQHLHAGIGQFLRDDRGGPAETHQHHVDWSFPLRHHDSPRR